jgi:TRAP-type mannitol/chloroaromatic compound transport system permease small subunit
LGWLILPLILFVCATVAAAHFGFNTLFSWGGEVPVFGSAVTVNTLLDLQWYVFAIIVLFGGVYAFRDDHHVNVDFISSTLSPRARMVIRLFGDLFLLLPFAAIIVWYGSKFAYSSYVSGESSTYGGLHARWVIKACLPLAFLLLGVAGLARALSTLHALVTGKAEQPDDSDGS